LVGGEEGAKAIVPVLQKVAASAILEARKSIYDELNPVLERYEGMFKPLLEQEFSLRKQAVEQVFLTRHPHFNETADDRDFARKVANTLMTTYPAEVSQMTADAFAG
jgi:hypothetical protein